MGASSHPSGVTNVSVKSGDTQFQKIMGPVQKLN